VVDQVGAKLRSHVLRHGLRTGDPLPSYRQLARELDVALMTVKRGVDALAADGFVKSIPKKGLFVAKEFNHKPKSLGHALLIFQSSMHHVMSHAYLTDLSRGVLSVLEPGGQGNIRSLRGEGIIFGDYVERLNPDGIFLMGVENDEYLRMAANWGRPVVSLDYCSESAPMDCVACDNRAATRRCVEHLVKLGHRRLAYLESWESINEGEKEEDRYHIQRSSDTRERREGVREAAAAAGLPEVPVFAIPARRELLDRMGGRSGQRPTALVVEGDLMVPDIIRGLGERGLRVPRDVSLCVVAGAGSLPECPGLTGCVFDFYAMGRKAVEVMQEQMARPGAPVNRIHRVGFDWEGGSTCGARA
jgi:LacI family transcriptional regulator